MWTICLKVKTGLKSNDHRRHHLRELGRGVHWWDSLAVQWLGLCAFTANGESLIPGPASQWHSVHFLPPKKQRSVMRNNEAS